ncbi:phenylalanine--tRNA ligase subunit alpha [Chloroflexota bacterium]
MYHSLQRIGPEALARLDAVESKEELIRWRGEYLGRQGVLTALLRDLGSLPVDQRPAAGRRANDLKRQLRAAMDVKRRALRSDVSDLGVDVSLPGRPPGAGQLHPITATMRRMQAAFRQMGFQAFRGRDVETDEYNFSLLNMSPYHPARDSHDTFYTTRPNVLLRTHTSPAQVQVMRQTGVPLRAVVPGTCYRYDQPDASHNWLFNQMEGFAVGTSIHLTDLLGTIRGLVNLLFGEKRQVRFRGHYFPFTEPSIEADLECTVCSGAGCRLCKESGWVEIIPGGMIHPTVLRNGGIDPLYCSGFAFGAGVDRIAALWYRLPDIRLLYENDLRFLEEF